jgi:hypothetical protein
MIPRLRLDFHLINAGGHPGREGGLCVSLRGTTGAFSSKQSSNEESRMRWVGQGQSTVGVEWPYPVGKLSCVPAL